MKKTALTLTLLFASMPEAFAEQCKGCGDMDFSFIYISPLVVIVACIFVGLLVFYFLNAIRSEKKKNPKYAILGAYFGGFISGLICILLFLSSTHEHNPYRVAIFISILLGSLAGYHSSPAKEIKNGANNLYPTKSEYRTEEINSVTENSFSPEAIEALANAGWYDQRNINIDHIVDTMKEDGFPLLENVLTFLKNFGDLKIQFISKRTGLDKDFDFDACEAMRIEVIERMDEYILRCDAKQLCLIGTLGNTYMVLLMDETGRMYAAVDSFFIKLGDNYIAAINNMVADDNRRHVEIPELP